MQTFWAPQPSLPHIGQGNNILKANVARASNLYWQIDLFPLAHGKLIIPYSCESGHGWTKSVRMLMLIMRRGHVVAFSMRA
jgi:hypothetical protein